MFGRKTPEEKLEEKKWRDQQRAWDAQHSSDERTRDRIIEEMLGKGLLVKLPTRYADTGRYSSLSYDNATPFVFGGFNCHLSGVFVSEGKAKLEFWITRPREYDSPSFYVKRCALATKIWISYERVEDWQMAIIQELDRITIENAAEFEQIGKLNKALSEAIVSYLETFKQKQTN